MILNTFILLCKHHHSLSPDLFSACRTEILYPLNSNFSLSSTPTPGNSFSTFCPCDFSCSNYSNKWSHTAFFLGGGNWLIFTSCSSVAKSCPILCDPMDCSTPGFSVLHYLLEFAQIHVLWFSDAIQPFHPLYFYLMSSVFISVTACVRVSLVFKAE